MAQSPFAIQPPVGFGPGSQSGEDEGLAYLPMPSGMRVYEPHLLDAEEVGGCAAALALLDGVQSALARWRPGDNETFSLAGLDAANRALIDEALGEGEVAVRVSGGGAPLEVQEATFAGVWRVRGAGGVDRIEVGAFPRGALLRAFPPQWEMDLDDIARPRPGVVNAPPILAEIAHRITGRAPGTPAHVINFSLLPHTPDDLVLIDQMLGQGGVTILSRGYGNCRIEAAARRDVWRVRFYNSTDMLILDTLEITELPEVAKAAPEDISDSAGRLKDVLEALA
ncbi:hydrogenase expression/formation protein [Azorhizobium doebereinerae]|uniref:hydrogenase expression/formation protein n=1 Tax=Azorhizobium doebereinerae TaxID=281091 RepID=UPI00041985B6|nr:hydrogenase expression/formation protein [Azorhizobium doebereinerae]